MDFANYNAIEFRRGGKVLHASFNRPDTMNAVDQVLEASFDYELISQQTRDHQEAADALREKRAPQFRDEQRHGFWRK
jgi:enoyl-CoA hydratase/carnithine racemase